MVLEKGLRLFGKKGDKAVWSEIQQLPDHEVMRSRSPASHRHVEHSYALQYLVFLKKQDGRIVGRGYADE